MSRARFAEAAPNEGAKTPVKDLDVLLARAWCQETSADPSGWSAENPSWGQCAVTALLVQDLLGGELLRSEVRGISHYWNRLPTGEEVDLTCQQFGSSYALSEPPEPRSREYVLSFPETTRRFVLLRARVAAPIRT